MQIPDPPEKPKVYPNDSFVDIFSKIDRYLKEIAKWLRRIQDADK